MSQFIEFGNKIINLDKIENLNKYTCKCEHEDITYTQIEIHFSDRKISFTGEEADVFWDFISKKSQNVLGSNL